MLLIREYTLGPLDNNTYLLIEPSTREAVIIDPSFESEKVLNVLQQENYHLTQVWITHAHFDHIAGVQTLADQIPGLTIGLHPDDFPLWQAQGGAMWMGWPLSLQVTPNLSLYHGFMLRLGDTPIQVRHTPGHSPGHVVFYLPSMETVFCGDLIFHYGIGRTDLPGGNLDQLAFSIMHHIFSLPDQTRLFPGHGPETSVGEERRYNPWLGYINASGSLT
ncbi:MAG: MBL fold metallo-hydrolase [Thermanaerothrix sp.]|nr:MBL fold metallo-hydrolase [Thermanaerothrix sp.]